MLGFKLLLDQKDLFYVHLIPPLSGIIVRIEFSPVVEIGVSKGHYFPQETTDEGPTLTNA